MSKRKDIHQESAVSTPDDQQQMGDIVDVEFEWFNPRPNDFHGLRTLLRQLFDRDNSLLDISELANHIIEQNLIGSMVKVDGIDEDPFAFLSEKPRLKSIADYLLQKSASSRQLEDKLKQLLSPGSNESVCLVMSERLVNMPIEVVPPMYSMLVEEMNWAIEDNEPYDFDHFLIISKVYNEILAEDPDQEAPALKKTKQRNRNKPDELFYFHQEDRIFLSKCNGMSTSFRYTNEQQNLADAKRVFSEMGYIPQGQLILLPKSKFAEAVEDLKKWSS